MRLTSILWILFSLLVLISITSCKRIHKRHPEMVGTWRHLDK